MFFTKFHTNLKDFLFLFSILKKDLTGLLVLIIASIILENF